MTCPECGKDRHTLEHPAGSIDEKWCPYCINDWWSREVFGHQTQTDLDRFTLDGKEQ